MSSEAGDRVEGADKIGTRAFRQVVGLVLGQLSILAAMALYFGWTRTTAFLRYFGLDNTVVRMSTTDYVLRSVGAAAYWPLVWIGLLVVIILGVHPRISTALAGMPEVRRRRYLGVVVLVAVAMLAIATTGLSQAWILPPHIPVVPLLVTSALALLTYSVINFPLLCNGRRLLGKAQFVTLSGLVAGGVFWVCSSYATAVGTTAAQHVAADLDHQVNVSVFSSQRLEVSGPGIREHPVGDERSVYRFRYTGLRLLLSLDNRHFLLSKEWRQGRDPVIVLSESREVRFEFSAPPYP